MDTGTRKAKVKKLMIQHTGEEKSVKEGENYLIDLMQAMNYYNQNVSDSVLAKYALAHVKKHFPKEYKVIQNAKISDCHFHHLGIIVRLLDIGSVLQPNDVARVDTYVHSLFRMAESIKAAQPKAYVSIQDRMREAERVHASAVDAAIDEIAAAGNTEFKPTEYFLSKKVPAVSVKNITAGFKPMLEELISVKAGKDAQLKEGYSNLSRLQINRMIKLLESLDSAHQSVKASIVHKPRKVKATKFKAPAYLASDVSLGVKSIDPSKVLGSRSLWTYNTRNRLLTRYISKEGFGIKGQTIQNYNIEGSARFTLRHPEKFFVGFKPTLAWINTQFKQIKTKGAAAPSRLSADTLILAAG